MKFSDSGTGDDIGAFGSNTVVVYQVSNRFTCCLVAQPSSFSNRLVDVATILHHAFSKPT